MALVERGGRLRLFPVQRVDGRTLQDAIRARVHLNTRMVTDDLKSYHGLDMGYAQHDTIKHSAKEYVRSDVHTNTVEGVFSLLKRGIDGQHSTTSRRATCTATATEFEFRYNTRTSARLHGRPARGAVGARRRRQAT